MGNSKKRVFFSTLLVLIAIAFGFWLGSSFLKWYSDKDIDDEKNGGTKTVSIFGKPEQPKTPKAVESRPAITPVPVDSTSIVEATADSLGMELQPSDSVYVADSLSIAYLSNDSLASESPLGNYHFLKKDKDQLVVTTTFRLPAKGKDRSQTTLQLDSLLGNIAVELGRDEIIMVELWKSPLNFRGYKLSDNVLVVYDMTNLDAFKMYMSDGRLFISYYDVFYTVTPTNEFKPLIPTSAPLFND